VTRRRRAAITGLASIALVLNLMSAGCTRLPSAPARPFTPPIRSVTLAAWTGDGYGGPAALAMLDAIAASGANSVTILVTAYQANAADARVRTHDPRTPTSATVREIAFAAASRGLSVAIKPHVDLDDGAWRGTLHPPDPDVWFDAYSAFVVPLARLADSLGAARFVVGTELAGTLEHAGRWRETIRQLRDVFPGTLTYAASWDEAHLVPFWDALDLVGVNAYFPVALRDRPGRAELLAGWAPWIERLDRLHERTGKRILLTEIGYRSADGAGREPYAYDGPATIDLEEQADLYWAALEATRDLPWMEGLDWWNFLASGAGGPVDADFTPFGKPALAELEAAWRS
jgi:hypothetical protein